MLPDRIRDAIDLEVFLWGGPERTCREPTLRRIAQERARLPIHAKDCAACIFRTEEWRDGGHCYMFREEPTGELCASFKPLTPKAPND